MLNSEIKLNPILSYVNLFERSEIPPQRFDSVHAILVTPDNQVVLVREKASDFFNLPGGRPEGDEDPESTLKRETMEEIGFSPEMYYLGELKTINGLSFGLYSGIINTADLTFGIQNDDSVDEIVEIKLISIEELQLLLFSILPGISQQIINILVENIKFADHKEEDG